MYLNRSMPRRMVFLLTALLIFTIAAPRVLAQSAVQTIESDDPRVLQGGTWSSQPAATASNGGYLFSSGAATDILGLSFVGSAIEIIYVAGPQFGTLAIEIDGTVVRTVITTHEKIEYGQVAHVDYLSEEPHTLKVYAQEGGVIAVDAFRISPIVGDSPVPTRDIPAKDDEAGGIQASTCTPINALHRVSLMYTGQQGNGVSTLADLSADGRYVTFESAAPLVLGDSNGFRDIYVYDRLTCQVELISVSTAGVIGNAHSDTPSISPNGRYVVFESLATTLVAGDSNGVGDIFLRDRQAATTIRVSVSTAGAQGDGNSFDPDLSANGRYVAFDSGATNLVAGDSNGQRDIFLRDTQTNTTTRLSVATAGTEGNNQSIAPSITSDGRYIAFDSPATNLVAGDTNGQRDIFLRDTQTNTTTRLSVVTGGAQATGGNSNAPAITSDGRFVAFESAASDLVTGDINGLGDIFVHDRQTNTTTRVSVATGGIESTGAHSFGPSISNDGRYVGFHSQAANLVGGDTNSATDIFVHDRTTSTTTRVSVAADGTQAIGSSGDGSISGDGRYVGFHSQAANLVGGDTNGAADVFVTPRNLAIADTLALFNPPFNSVMAINTLQDNPPYTAYTTFSAYAPVTNGQWVMGDWNGDGLDTPGVYANGPFYYTNKSGESQASDWRSLWIGISGPPVAGRFNGAVANDCIGAVQTASLGGATVFVLYYTCQLDGTPAPTISNQWLSAVLPDNGGFSGTHQFGAGDFNSDGVDSIAVRRGTSIAFGNVAPATGPATFDLAQYIGIPQAGADTGIFVVGDWDADGIASFGLFYQNGEFFFRNDLTFNSGTYVNQSVGTPLGGNVQTTTWR